MVSRWGWNQRTDLHCSTAGSRPSRFHSMTKAGVALRVRGSTARGSGARSAKKWAPERRVARNLEGANESEVKLDMVVSFPRWPITKHYPCQNERRRRADRLSKKVPHASRRDFCVCEPRRAATGLASASDFAD